MSALIFFYCQIIAYVVDLSWRKVAVGGAYFAELILPQPQPFSNPIDWMYQPLHFCSWLPIVTLLLLLSWFCIFLKAITYLQSAYRLKGEDMIEAHDITEIAGVWYYSCQYYWDSLGGGGGVCVSLIWISNLVVSILRSRPCPCWYLTQLYVVCRHFVYSFITVLRPFSP